MLSFIVGAIAIIGFVLMVKNKSFWSKKLIFRLPFYGGLLYLLFSLPVILNFNGNIHGPYTVVYCYLNFIVINFFGNTIDQVELYLFGERSLSASNVALGIISVLFWIISFFIIGLFIDIKRRLAGKKD